MNAAIVIALAELKSATSGLRKIRLVVLLFIIGFFIFYFFRGAQALMTLLMSEVQPIPVEIRPFLLQRLIAPMLSMALLSISFLLFLIPIVGSIRDPPTGGFYEMIFSTPVQPWSFVVGRFLARLPLLLILIFLIGPLVAIIFRYLVGISPYDMILITFLLAWFISLVLWIGNLLANLINSWYVKNPKAKDFGGILSVLLALGFILIYYSLLTTSTEAIEQKNWQILQFLPSTWASNLFLGVIAPDIHIEGIISPQYSLILLIGLTGLVIFGGKHIGQKFFSFEESGTPTTKRSQQISPSAQRFYKFYHSLSRILSAPEIVPIIARDFYRRKENIAKLVYSMILPLVFLYFFGKRFSEIGLESGFNLIMIWILVFLPSMLAGSFLGGVLFIRSKESLWIYQNTVGIKSFVFAYFWFLIVTVFPFYIILYIVICFFISLPWYYYIAIIPGILASFIGNLLVPISIQCLYPTFEDKSKQNGIVTFLQLLINFGCLLGGLFGFIAIMKNVLLSNFELFTFGWFFGFLVNVPLVIGLILMYIGLKTLPNKI